MFALFFVRFCFLYFLNFKIYFLLDFTICSTFIKMFWCFWVFKKKSFWLYIYIYIYKFKFVCISWKFIVHSFPNCLGFLHFLFFWFSDFLDFLGFGTCFSFNIYMRLLILLNFLVVFLFLLVSLKWLSFYFTLWFWIV